MHYCIDCSQDPVLKRKHQLKSNLIHLFVSIVLVLITPFIISFFTNDSLGKIKEKSNQNQGTSTEYYIATVDSIIQEKQEQSDIYNGTVLNQKVKVSYTDKNNQQKTKELEWVNQTQDTVLFLKQGDKVVLNSVSIPEAGEEIYIQDKFRLTNLIWIFAIFILLVVALAGFRGITALAGLIFSATVLIQYMVPQILTGQNLVFITFSTSLLILVVSIYLAHGISKQTHVTFASSVITISIASIIAVLTADFVFLSGFGGEEVMGLRANPINSGISLQGILISGIIIGSLGILDDVTTAQAAAIQQIYLANPKLKFKDLFIRGILVGQEHIISLVNTLALAYAGTALPIILLYVIYNNSPLWVILNNTLIAEELIRGILGSFAILMAVPIATFLGAKFLINKENIDNYKRQDFSFSNIKLDKESNTYVQISNTDKNILSMNQSDNQEILYTNQKNTDQTEHLLQIKESDQVTLDKETSKETKKISL